MHGFDPNSNDGQRANTAVAALRKRPLRRGTAERTAYTLLEVLIVTALLTAIFAGIWTLLRSWSGIYEDGQERTAESQLVRSLIGQFQDDLHAVAYTAAPERGRRSSRNGRRRISLSSVEAMAVTLVGGSDWLVVDVLQMPSPFHPGMSRQASTEEGPAREDFSQHAVTLAPELMRVVYTFEPPAEELEGAFGSGESLDFGDDTEAVDGGGLLDEQGEPIEPFTGLLRVATYREQFSGISSGESATERQMGRKGNWRQLAYRLREIVTGGDGMDVDATDSLAGATEAQADDSFDARPDRLAGIAEQDEMPEVNWLEIRYYDGGSWRTAWDSSRTGELPVAVELRFNVEKVDSDVSSESISEDAEVSQELPSLDRSFDTSMEEMPLADDTLGVSSGLDGQLAEETPYHRCVVFLRPPNSK